MKGVRGALVLLPTDPGAEPAHNPFEQWLATAGWNAETGQLCPPSTHATLGWRACAVKDCNRPAWGTRARGLCEGCNNQWQLQGKPAREVFDQRPASRRRVEHRPVLCLVTRAGVRCGRDAQNKGLCSPHSSAVARSARSREDAIAELLPMPSLGGCRVAACDRVAHLPGTLLCQTHGRRWLAFERTIADADLDDWCRRAKQVTDGRRAVLAGVNPHVRMQILYGVYSRSRRGSRTRLDHLQRVVDWVRWLQVTDLLDVRNAQVPNPWPRPCEQLLKTILPAVEYGDQRPEDFRHADVWPGVVFGKTGNADFRGISQAWLREITQAWCWDNLSRSNNFQMFANVLHEAAYFSDYLRANAASAGNAIDCLDRSTITGFAAYLAALVEQGAERYRAQRNGRPAVYWNRGLQRKCLLAIKRILHYGRETGHLKHFDGSFMLTDDLLIPAVKNSQDDEVGAALPTEVIRQLFVPAAIGTLASLNAHLPPMLRLAAETGRRPGELVSLKYDCVDIESHGGPFLIYTETKVTDGQERRLPVLDIVVDTVRRQQAVTRERYPDPPIADLRLFPRMTMNPHGYHPIHSSQFGEGLRRWVDALPRLDSAEIGSDGNPLPFNRSQITGYSFRHTYAQRHADAGVAPDVLMALMGHEHIGTTMGYYRIPQKRRRQAVELVGNLVVDGEHLAFRHMTRRHRLADERGTVAISFGKCSNPQNVAAEGYGCPIRHQCFGCGSFSSDPSYLPEMKRRLLDLKAIRARVDAFDGASEWAKRDARPSDEEIKALERHITDAEDKLALATPEQRALIEDASVILRKARAAAQVNLTLRRPDGGDALAPHVNDGRHAIDTVGRITDV